MLTRLAAGLCAGAALSLSCLPVSAAVDNDLPVRWNSGGAVWSTNQTAFNTFISDGTVTDRGLSDGIARSGWTSDELRTGLSKTYNVDLVGVSRFLYSDAGVKFLKNQSRSYFPYWTMSTYAVEGLRSAIIAAAAGGQISALAIMAHLPTDFSTGQGCGRLGVCAPSKCVGEAQCTSLLSWYVFLPACLQANQARQVGAVGLGPLVRTPKP